MEREVGCYPVRESTTDLARLQGATEHEEIDLDLIAVSE